VDRCFLGIRGLDTAGRYLVDPIAAISNLVTDVRVSDELLAPYQTQGIQILQE